MINVLKTEYWSRTDAFLLPLTGLQKNGDYGIKSYLFWNENSIDDYRLTISYSYEDYGQFLEYCKNNIFPVLDKKGYLVESYDIPVQNRTVFVLDMSEWAMDIQMFLSAKYSKLSKEAKSMIERFHTYNKNFVPVHIYAVLYPTMKMPYLDNMSPIDYVAKHYEINKEYLTKLGEIGSVYDEVSETLITDVEKICQDVSKK